MEMFDASVLPMELIVEILSWVPVKALMRFKCVSKTWNFFVFDPTFVKLHLERSSKHTRILLNFLIQKAEGWICTAAPCSIPCLLENPLSTVDDCLHRFNLTDAVVGACNGLVCLQKRDFVFVFNDEFEVIWFRFWNPATRHMSKDSPPLRFPLSKYNYWMNYGFGFDERSSTYKVVVLLYNTISQTMEVEVHCMGDTCWKKILTCPIFHTLAFCDGQFTSGTVNWLALRMSSYCHQWKTVTTIDQLIIFSYYLKNESYRYLLMPQGLVEIPHVEPYLTVLKGCLCLSHDHRKTHFVVWIMRKFGVEKSWTQLLKVSYGHLQNPDRRPYMVIPLCMSQDEDVLLLADYRGGDLVLYNWRDDKIDHTKGFKDLKKLFRSYEYVESLVLPN